MSASVGLGLLANKAAADMSCPAWQYPHCGTSSSSHAFCNGCDPSADKPSIVVTGALTAEICVWQALLACPPMCTVHAPHCPMPHPNFVPFILRTSLDSFNRSVDRRDLRLAGSSRLPANVHRTRATLSDAASELRSLHIENVSQYPKKGHVWWYVNRFGLPINGQFVGHIIISLRKD